MKLHLRWLEGCLGVMAHDFAGMPAECLWALIWTFRFRSRWHTKVKKKVYGLTYKCLYSDCWTYIADYPKKSIWDHLQVSSFRMLNLYLRLPKFGETLRRSRSRSRARSPPNEHPGHGAHRWTSRERLHSIRASGEGSQGKGVKIQVKSNRVTESTINCFLVV